MAQIVNRRTVDATLGTLADNNVIEFDNIMEDLTHKAFLFEYMIKFRVKTLNTTNWFGQAIQVCLIKGDLAGSTLDTFLTGAQITQTDEHTDVPTRQDLFEVATIKTASVVSGTDAYLNGELRFAPKAKGGIPFTEGTGTGWKVVVINRTGSNLSTGNLLAGEVYERFAYEGT